MNPLIEACWHHADIEVLRCAAGRKLAGFGERACREGFGIEPFTEAHRDIHTFTRRAGRLPEQRDSDAVDYRPLLHRDGSVLSAVSLQVPLSLWPGTAPWTRPTWPVKSLPETGSLMGSISSAPWNLSTLLEYGPAM